MHVVIKVIVVIMLIVLEPSSSKNPEACVNISFSFL